MKKNPLLVVLGISAACFTIFLVVSLVVVFYITSDGKGFSKKRFFSGSNEIGVIEINGVISDSKKYSEQIQRFDEDRSVRAVVVRLNSPGGAVGPSQEIYEGLRKLAQKKPVYSSMGSIAASGAYYIAVGTKKIFANPGTITGSIGVIMPFADLSALFQWAKIKPYSIKTGKFKDIGSINREMSADEKKLVQGMVDNVLHQFRQAISLGRGLSMGQVSAISDGRILTGEQAKQMKLVDELGGFQQAVEALAKEAGIKEKPRLVYAHKKKSVIERFLTDDEDYDYDMGLMFL